MLNISDKVEHPFTVEKDTDLTGMITHNTTVKPGVLFIVSGMITADLIIEPGATVLVPGMVNGRIHNSGKLTISGIVDSVIDLPGSTTTIEPHAIVRHQN